MTEQISFSYNLLFLAWEEINLKFLNRSYYASLNWVSVINKVPNIVLFNTFLPIIKIIAKNNPQKFKFFFIFSWESKKYYAKVLPKRFH